eukprot:scaffold1513_cov100-Amphora_coffeaeformis.AAC.9
MFSAAAATTAAKRIEMVAVLIALFVGFPSRSNRIRIPNRKKATQEVSERHHAVVVTFFFL